MFDYSFIDLMTSKNELKYSDADQLRDEFGSKYFGLSNSNPVVYCGEVMCMGKKGCSHKAKWLVTLGGVFTFAMCGYCARPTSVVKDKGRHLARLPVRGAKK